MSYQNPQILYFLFALAIPIFIHLFNLRKHKVVYFSNVRFLKEIQSEKKKRNTIKQLLILLSRLLAITALILAFSNPFIPSENNKSDTKNTFIYIDNSFSMDNISVRGHLLDVAKEDAINILENIPEDHNIWILNNQFTSSSHLSKNKKQAKESILSINTSSDIRSKKDIIEKQNSISKESSTLYIISDFQKSSTNKEEFNTTDSNLNIILIPQQQQLKNNISIDSCYLSSPINTIGNITTISSLITNNSEEKVEGIVVNLSINKQHKTQQNISLLKGESKKIELYFVLDNSKINNGIIYIEEYPITFDNKLYFSFMVEDKIKVCQIYETENTSINTLFQSQENTKYNKQYIHQLDYNLINDQNIIFINEIKNYSSGFINSMQNYVSIGGTICIIPSDEMNMEEYNQLLSQLECDLIQNKKTVKLKISDLNLNHPIFKDVFSSNKLKTDIHLPTINNHYPFRRNSHSIKQNIFRLENGAEFLNNYKKDKGEVYVFASKLSEAENDFHKHALFVTTLFNMSLQSVQAKQIYYTLNKNSEISLPKSNPNLQNIFHIKKEDKDIIADYQSKKNNKYLLIHNQITEANHYQLLQETELLSSISFNYDRKESNITQYEKQELEEYITLNKLSNISVLSSDKNLQYKIEKLNSNKEYWKLFILLALLFISLEILLIKIIKS